MCAYEKAMGENEYYESVLKLVAMLETKEIHAKRLNGQKWYEIDDIQDLDIAEVLFMDTDRKKYDRIMSRYGGYWRFPRLLDFCYLVNPYFPPQRMLEEMKASLVSLLTYYPSGMAVNSLLAEKVFGIPGGNIAVGNGAAELIKALLDRKEKWGKVGIVLPSFEEYANRFGRENCVFFRPDNLDFSYTQKELIQYFEKKNINTLLLINPDNPSGNYIPKHGVIELLEWSGQKGISLILDESFVDFVDDAGAVNTCINEKILMQFPHLYVVKSISKSYGVPGLRLGVLASADVALIAEVKKNVPIWNINSFAEFFMQMFEKYKKEYLKSLAEIRESRADFISALEKIPYIRVIPSQANYVMCELLDGVKSGDFVVSLLDKGILVKDLGSKVSNGKQYVRIAVRSREDNKQLIAALKDGYT